MILRFLNIAHLSSICLAQADDMHCVAALRENYAVEAFTNDRVSDFTQFEIVAARVGLRQHIGPVNFSCQRERNAVLPAVARALGRVERDFQVYCRYKNIGLQGVFAYTKTEGQAATVVGHTHP
jgi:hypothetical protein